MTNILPLFLFALSTTFTPGPNNIMLAASGANFGFRRTLPHMLGIMVGFPFMVVAVGLGLGRLFHNHPVVWEIMRIAGFIFLLFLAWKIATFYPREHNAGQSSKPLAFWQAALFQWLNPKAWVLVLVAIPAYTSSEGDVIHQVLVIGLVYFIVSFPATATWTLFGTTFRRWLTSKKRRLFNGGLAFLLVASVASAWLFH